jgi:hypothetical protein
VRSVGEGELERIGLRRQSPAVGGSCHEAALLEGAQGVAEAGVVDAEALAEGGPGEGLVGAAQLVAYGVGEGRRLVIAAVEVKVVGLVDAAGEPEQDGLWGRCSAVLDGEAEALVGAAEEIASGVGPGMEVGAAPERLSGVTV